MHKKIIGASAVAVIGTMAAPSALWAQGGVTRQVSISASAGIRHESNLAHTTAAQAAARGISRSDQKFSPALNVNMVLPFGPHNFSLSGNASYDFHRKNDRLNRERINFNSGLAMNLPICDPSLSASFARNQSDLGDIIITPGAPPISIENVETVKSIGGTVACGKDYGLRPTVGIDYQEGRNSRSERQGRERNVTSYSAGLGYLHPSIGDLLLFAQQRDTRFINQILPDGRESGNRVRSYGGRFKRAIGSRLQGSVEATYTELSSRQPGVRNFHGLNWAADLTATVSPRMVVQASLSRSISSSLAIDSNYNLNTNYGLDATYAISPVLNLQGGFSLSRRRFQGTQPITGPGIPTPEILTRDQRNSFFASLSYVFSPKLKFILDGAHERRNANSSIFDYSNNRIGLRAEFSL